MTRLARAGRLAGHLGGHLGGRVGGLDVLVGLSSQQGARRNAAGAAAVLLRRRQEREQVEAFLAQHGQAAYGEAVRPVSSGDVRTGTA